MRNRNDSGSGDGTLVLQFSGPMRKHQHSATGSECELTIQDVSFDMDGLLRVQGDVNSGLPVANVSAYVGEQLLGTKSFSQTDIFRPRSFSFESNSRLDENPGRSLYELFAQTTQGDKYLYHVGFRCRSKHPVM